jgi:hypothetical protein
MLVASRKAARIAHARQRSQLKFPLRPLQLACTLLVGLAVFGAERVGRAQSATLITGKAMVGGALLGSEAVLLTEAALGAKPGWMIAVGGVAGAGMGATAGYYIGHGGTSTAPAFMLAGGLALVMPTLLAILTATHFDPEGYRQDVAPEDAVPTDEAAPFDEEAPLEPPAAEPAPAGARLDLPSVALRHAFSAAELQQFRVPQVTELHVAVLAGRF